MRKITAIPMKNKPLYELLYTKHDRFGFTKEQDLQILRKMYPDAKEITIVYSMPGEVHFVIKN